MARQPAIPVQWFLAYFAIRAGRRHEIHDVPSDKAAIVNQFCVEGVAQTKSLAFKLIYYALFRMHVGMGSQMRIID